MLTRENFDARFELKAVPDAAGKFIGLASTFGNVDQVDDVVAPGAFTATLAKFRAAGRMPAMLWSHRTDAPIGIWESMAETKAGLVVQGRLLLDIQRGREAHVALKAGAIDGLSIGFRTINSKRDEKTGSRILTEIELFEVSLVVFPANDQARVTGVKMALAAGDIPEKRAVEEALREMGFSVRQAKKLIAGGYDELTKHRGDNDSVIAAIDRAGRALGTGAWRHGGTY